MFLKKQIHLKKKQIYLKKEKKLLKNLFENTEQLVNFDNLVFLYNNFDENYYFFNCFKVNFFFEKKMIKKIKKSIKLRSNFVYTFSSIILCTFKSKLLFDRGNVTLSNSKLVNWWGRTKSIYSRSKKLRITNFNYYYYKFCGINLQKFLKKNWKKKFSNIKKFFLFKINIKQDPKIFFYLSLFPQYKKKKIEKKYKLWSLKKNWIKKFFMLNEFKFFNLKVYNLSKKINMYYYYLFCNNLSYKYTYKTEHFFIVLSKLISILNFFFDNFFLNIFKYFFVFSLFFKKINILYLGNTLLIAECLLYYLYLLKFLNISSNNTFFYVNSILLKSTNNNSLYTDIQIFGLEWELKRHIKTFNSVFVQEGTPFIGKGLKKWLRKKKLIRKFIIFRWSINWPWSSINNWIVFFNSIILNGYNFLTTEKLFYFYLLKEVLIILIKWKFYFLNTNLFNLKNLKLSYFIFDYNSSKVLLSSLNFYKSFILFINFYKSVFINLFFSILNFNNFLCFSLNIEKNYSFVLNKFIYLDLFSTLEIFKLFSHHSLFNSLLRKKIIFYGWKFFWKKLFNYKILEFFEIFLVKKFFIFDDYYIIFNFYYKIFKLYWYFEKSELLNFFKWILKKKYVINSTYFVVELHHLLIEFLELELEKAWLSERKEAVLEVWFTKLIDHIKYLYSKNEIPGNIQYSPDFNHLHEFVLTYRWGLELEQLWFTKPLIENRNFKYLRKSHHKNLIVDKFFFLKKLQLFKESGFINENDDVKEKVNHLITIKNSQFLELLKINFGTILSLFWDYFRKYWLQLTAINDHFYVRKSKLLTKFILFNLMRNLHIFPEWWYFKWGREIKIVPYWKFSFKQLFEVDKNLPIFFSSLKNLKSFFYFFIFLDVWKNSKILYKLKKSLTMYKQLHKAIFQSFQSFMPFSLNTENDYITYCHHNLMWIERLSFSFNLISFHNLKRDYKSFYNLFLLKIFRQKNFFIYLQNFFDEKFLIKRGDFFFKNLNWNLENLNFQFKFSWLLNFCSEFLYDQYTYFFNKKIFFKNYNFYHNYYDNDGYSKFLSKNFSNFFFYSLYKEQNIFNNKNSDVNLLLINFLFYLHKWLNFIVFRFIKKLYLNFLENLNNKNTNKLKSKSYEFKNFIYLFLKKIIYFFFKKNNLYRFVKKILLLLFYRIVQHIKILNPRIKIKLITFYKVYLFEFIGNLNFFFILLILKLIKFCVKN